MDQVKKLDVRHVTRGIVGQDVGTPVCLPIQSISQLLGTQESGMYGLRSPTDLFQSEQVRLLCISSAFRASLILMHH